MSFGDFFLFWVLFGGGLEQDLHLEQCPLPGLAVAGDLPRSKGHRGNVKASKMSLPKIRVLFGGPYNKDDNIWDLYGGPPCWENTKC